MIDQYYEVKKQLVTILKKRGMDAPTARETAWGLALHDNTEWLSAVKRNAKKWGCDAREEN